METYITLLINFVKSALKQLHPSRCTGVLFFFLNFTVIVSFLKLLLIYAQKNTQVTLHHTCAYPLLILYFEVNVACMQTRLFRSCPHNITTCVGLGYGLCSPPVRFSIALLCPCRQTVGQYLKLRYTRFPSTFLFIIRCHSKIYACSLSSWLSLYKLQICRLVV